MGRPRTPTNILEIRGAYRTHPERRKQRANEPTGIPGLGEPPERLDEAEKAAWAEIAATCAQGVLTQADRLVVEMSARLLVEFRDMGRDFQTAKLGLLRSLLGSCGMSPSDRTKVGVAKPEAVNRFAKFADKNWP